MKKNLLFAMLLTALCMGFTACSDKEEETTNGQEEKELTTENQKAWMNYAVQVASLLNADSERLYNEWNNTFAALFKAHNSGAYTSAESAVEQIIDGCVDIANEVGTAKIGDPYNKAKAGNLEEAVLAVESWYSWHSRDDYTNNIYSIRNSWYGSLTDAPVAQSLYQFVKEGDEQLAGRVTNAISAAATAIQAIQQPFRNNILSKQTEDAMTACADLAEILDHDLRNYVSGHADEARYSEIINQFVDVVVMPTYKDLKDKNYALYQAVTNLNKAPSDEAFANCAMAWMNARKPWETSEAFLFGPVANLGLDPNMDSWPLDQAAIQSILSSKSWENMTWSGKYVSEDDLMEEILDELGLLDVEELTPEQEALVEQKVEERKNSDPEFKADMEQAEKISAAQNVRGYHTLEFLIFKDGEARKFSEIE
ncbi:MAG: peptidase M75 [Bacteroidaceae bacterium]|nr:peptidase M75 [Bacteroidaceae bacterium]